MPIPYFDAHCDTGVPVYFRKKSLRENSFHLDLERLRAFAPAAQVFAVCVHWKPDEPDNALKVFDTLCHEIWRNGDIAMLCRSSADITKATEQGKIACLLSMEGAEQFGCTLEQLGRLRTKGLSIVHLTWNHDNALSGAAMDSGAGLTPSGREFVAVAQSMGVVLDMSHLSERGFWDVLELARKPVLAGHSDSRALCDHPRNLTDAQFKALADAGGVAGLNFCRAFLGLGEDLEAIVAHAEHFLALGGERSVCLGTDYDGIDRLPEGISGAESMGALYEAMLRKNWSETLVRGIFWDNLRAFFGRAM